MIGEFIIAGALYETFFKDGTARDKASLKETIREIYKIVDDKELELRVKDLEYEAKEVARRHRREDEYYRKNCQSQLY